MRKEMQRDEGLARLARGTRWLTAGAVISAAGLSVAVAETLPGRSSAAVRPAPPAAGPTAQTTPSSVPPATPATTPPTAPPQTAPAETAPPQTAPPETLAPPTTPPTTAYSPPVASSGGS